MLLKKSIAVVLTVIFSIMQPAVMLAEESRSADEIISGINISGYGGNTGQQQYANPGISTGSMPATNNSVQDTTTVFNSLAAYYLEYYKNLAGWGWLSRTQVGFKVGNGTPQWNVNTLQPLWGLDDDFNKLLFVQGNFTTANNTLNAGLGYRIAAASRRSMYGVNVFYDNQFSVPAMAGQQNMGSHGRAGAGLEYFNGPYEVHANGYFGVTPDVYIGSEPGWEYWQRVANGYDLSVNTDFSAVGAPWAKVGVTGYQYFFNQSLKGVPNQNQQGLTLDAAVQITPQLQLAADYDFGASAGSIEFNFNLLAPLQPAMLFADKKINDNSDKDVTYKMLQPVQRNNVLVTETYTCTVGKTVKINVHEWSGTADAAEKPVNNVKVTLGSSQPVYTDADGVALIPGVKDGSYLLTLEKSGYDTTSNGQVTISNGVDTTGVHYMLPSGDYNCLFAAALPQTGGISVEVFDTEGTEVTPDSVKIIRNGKKLNDVQPVIEGNKVNISGLEYGEYSVILSKAGYAQVKGLKVKLEAENYNASAVITNDIGTGIIRVTDEDKKNLSVDSIEVRKDGAATAFLENVPAGDAEIPCMAEGEYEVVVNKTNYIQEKVWKLSIVKGQTDKITGALKIAPGIVNVLLREADKTTATVTGTQITAINGAGKEVDWQKAGADGLTKFKLTPGNYTFRVYDADLSTDKIEISSNSEQLRELVYPEDSREIKVALKNTDGTVAAGCWITVIQNGRKAAELLSDKKGEAVFWLSDGEYTVTNNSGITQRLIVSGGSQQLVLQGGDLEVAVLRTDGTPWAGANIVVNTDKWKYICGGVTNKEGKLNVSLTDGLYIVYVEEESGIIAYDVKVNNGQKTQAILNAAEYSGSVKVTVVDESGVALAPDSMEISRNNEVKYSLAGTDEPVFRKVVSGSYDLTVKKDGYAQKQAVSFKLPKGQNETGIKVVLTKNSGVVELAIADLKGKQIFPETAELLQNGKAVYSLQSGGSKKAVFYDVVPGSYNLETSKKGYRQSRLQVVEITAGNRLLIPVVLSDELGEGIISVVDCFGKPLVPAKITVGYTGNVVYRNLAPADNTVRITGVLPGVYDICIEKAGYKQIDNAKLVVVKGQTDKKQIFMDPQPANVEFEVTDEISGLPVDDAAVSLCSVDGAFVAGRANTAQNGKASIYVVDGEFLLNVEKTGYFKTSERVKISGGVAGKSVYFVRKELLKLTVFVSDSSGVLRQSLVTLDGVQQLTDEQGRAVFSGLRKGSHTVAVSRPGYVVSERKIELDAADIETEILLQKNVAAAVKVTVKNREIALPGAKVTLNGVVQAVDSNGIAAFPSVVNGSYLLDASAPGYALEQPLHILVDGEDKEYVLDLAKITSADVSVFAYDGQNPVAGAAVTLGKLQQQTGIDGYAAFPAVPNGVYDLNVAKAGYMATAQQVVVDGIMLQKQAVLTKNTTANVSVAVYDGQAPLSGAALTMSGYPGPAAEVGGGNYLFTNVPNGVHVLTVNKQKFESYSGSEFSVDGVDVTHPAVSLRANTCADLTVRISDNGSGAGGVTVTVVSQSSGLSHSGVTGSDGRAVFSRLDNGAYTINAIKNNYNKAIFDTVVDGEALEVTAELYGYKKVVADLFDETGKPLDNIPVQISDGAGVYSATVNSSGGRVVFDAVPNGNYAVSASVPGYAPPSQSFELRNQDVAVRLVAKDRNPSAAVAVIARDAASGNVLDGVRVQLGSLSAVTGANGSVRFENVKNGNYTAAVSKTDYEESVPVPVVVGGLDQEIAVSLLCHYADLEINVNKSNGSKAYGAKVELAGRTATASSGTTVFRKVANGEYSLKVSMNGYAAASDVVVKAAGKNAAYEVVLYPDVVINVLDYDDSMPVQGVEVTFDNSDNIGKKFFTNEKGQATLSGIPDGSYHLNFRPDSKYGSYSSSSYNSLRISGGKISYSDRYKLSRASHAVKTRVVDNNNKPVKDVKVSFASDKYSKYNKEDKTGDDGYTGGFWGTYLYDGIYTVTTEKEGYRNTAQAVTIKGTSQNSVSIRIEKAFDIRIQVKDKSGNALAGVDVNFNNGSKQLVTDSSGYAVIQGQVAGTYPLLLRTAAFKDLNTSVSLTAAGVVNPGSFMLEQAYKDVKLRVADITDNAIPVVGARIVLNTGATAVSDKDGYAIFRNLPDGKYSAKVEARGRIAVNGEQLSVNGGLVYPTIIKMYARTAKVRIVAANHGNYNEPLAGVLVKVNGATLGTTDTYGDVILKNVDEGEKYRLSFIHDGLVNNQQCDVTIKSSGGQYIAVNVLAAGRDSIGVNVNIFRIKVTNYTADDPLHCDLTVYGPDGTRKAHLEGESSSEYAEFWFVKKGSYKVAIEPCGGDWWLYHSKTGGDMETITVDGNSSSPVVHKLHLAHIA